MATLDDSARAVGMDLIRKAANIAKARQGAKPFGEGHWETFIGDSDAAFTEIATLLDDATGKLNTPKAKGNLRGGTDR